jgi:hypothetical protein
MGNEKAATQSGITDIRHPGAQAQPPAPNLSNDESHGAEPGWRADFDQRSADQRRREVERKAHPDGFYPDGSPDGRLGKPAPRPVEGGRPAVVADAAAADRAARDDGR